MDKLEAARQQYAEADASLRRRNLNNHPDMYEQQLYRAITALGTMVEALTARVAELEAAAYEAGAGENTIDHAALEEDERDRLAADWTAENEGAYQAEAPRTLPHQL